MNNLNGDEATKRVFYLMQIKDLILNERYVNCEIIGYSSDYSKEICDKFEKAGACCTELKPCTLTNFRKLISKHVLK